MNQFEAMEFQRIKTMCPKRFNCVEDNKYLKYKFAKETRDKKIRLDRWAKLNREDIVIEKFTRDEIWDNYIKETR